MTALSILYLHYRMGLKEMKDLQVEFDLYTIQDKDEYNADLIE